MTFTARKLASIEIRETFLRFFEERGHLRIGGSSLLPKNDPTLLYINSGMAPLKRYFTGEEEPPHPDLCNIQPCIRTKDIDDVGDRHHLTFFEMLGSWSINHYFKQRAVELAYELLVERFGFPAERLYATVYGGDPELNLPPDDESVAAWERVGLARNHIVVLGEDNFWGPAGGTGPCGPCTEVFFDTGAEHGPPYREGGYFDTKGRYIEIWNAGVFMEYDKHAEGVYAKLPFRSVDTGSGLERMSMVLNALESVHETDLVGPLMQYIAEQFPNPSVSLATRRRIADHMRASTFILAEGVIPSNEGCGYIPRQLIRKCIALVFREGAAFDYRGLIDLVIERFGGFYARLKENRRQIHEAFANERTGFEQVIDRGLRRLDALSEKRPFLVSGKDAFALFSTFGMPYDLIRDFVADRGGTIDEAGYLQEFRTHQKVSRVSRKAADADSAELAELYQTLSAQIPVVEFVGYETLTSAARILAMVDLRSSGPRHLREATPGEEIEVILDRTPAYAEAGGQVGDTGTIVGRDGRAEIVDTYYRGSKLIVNRVRLVAGWLREGEEVVISIESPRRHGLRRHHTGTHLLHAALRKVLGPHVMQAGSLVAPDHLRFDFSHGRIVDDHEMEQIEELVNEHAQSNLAVTLLEMDLGKALRMGALALFGEKYGQRVRVIKIGDFSTELCGGTHLDQTGELGLLKITMEGAVAAGVRRVEAVAGTAALKVIERQERTLREAAEILKIGPADVPERLRKLLDEQRALEKRLKDLEARLARFRADELVGAARQINGVAVVAGRVDGLNPDALCAVVDRLREHLGSGVVCVGSVTDGKVNVVAAVTNDLTKRFHAGTLVQGVANAAGGSGGGRPELAQAGARDPERLDRALALVYDFVERGGPAV